MRKMKHQKTGDILEVTEHIILKNFWEYYLTEEDTGDNDVKFGYVMGMENELGYIYLPEIKPYIISKTNDLSQVMPASGYDWIE